MRTKEEILSRYQSGIGYYDNIERIIDNQELILEVLIDIRDILNRPHKIMPSRNKI